MALTQSPAYSGYYTKDLASEQLEYSNEMQEIRRH